mmetsp:Transcript_169/g.554  ORF Transcript_169/g.554 Transcript_169/m.554 type:complete len:222 (+) Transcript_169:1452-2117(+)
MQLNEGTLPLGNPLQTWIWREARTIEGRNPQESLSQRLVFYDGQSPNATVQSPENRELHEQWNNSLERIDLQVHEEHSHFLVQPVLIVLVLLLELLHPRVQHLHLRSRFHLGLHEWEQNGPNSKRIADNCPAERLRNPKTFQTFCEALHQSRLTGNKLRPQVVGQRLSLGIQQHVAVFVPLQPRIKKELCDGLPCSIKWAKIDRGRIRCHRLRCKCRLCWP